MLKADSFHYVVQGASGAARQIALSTKMQAVVLGRGEDNMLTMVQPTATL